MTLSDLLLLLTVVVTVGALTRTCYLLARGRWRAVLGLRTVLGLYTVALVTVSLTSPRQALGLGQDRCFDDWSLSVQAVAHLRSIGAVEARGEFYLVTVRASSRARGSPSAPATHRCTCWTRGASAMIRRPAAGYGTITRRVLHAHGGLRPPAGRIARGPGGRSWALPFPPGHRRPAELSAQTDHPPPPVGQPLPPGRAVRRPREDRPPRQFIIKTRQACGRGERKQHRCSVGARGPGPWYTGRSLL